VADSESSDSEKGNKGMSSDNSDSEGDDAHNLFINPLSMQTSGKSQQKMDKNDEDNISEGVWSEDEEDEREKNKLEGKKPVKKETNLGKRTKREEDDLHDFFHSKQFEEVPQENLEDGYSSMDSDDMAETRALAKKMLRKKTREEILDSTYNRFSNFDDPSTLPQWF